MSQVFRLSKNFLSDYEGRQPNWGFGELSYFTYKRTYSRLMPDGKQEEYYDTVKRVVEGVFSIQKKHCMSMGLPWDNRKSQKSAQIMFQKIWEFKFTPPGRGFWVMGTDVIEKKGGAALNNCGFRSTQDIGKEFGEPFAWATEMLMLGVGIGFDTRGAGQVTITKPVGSKTFIIPDTREGWAEAVKVLLDSYDGKPDRKNIVFDSSLIRPAGSIIHTFGGTASGPDPLMEGLENIRQLLDKADGLVITSVMITDIMNHVGRFVVAGNVRRSAEIAFSQWGDRYFMEMKDPDLFPEELASHRWLSNNSLFAYDDSDFSQLKPFIAKNGEPGLLFLDNCRHYGRIKDGWLPENSPMFDNCMGANPCVEQLLEDGELCCVTADTRILTKDGYPKIKSVIGQEVEIWNGKEWSKVTPFLAGRNKDIYRVTLSDGSYLDVTDNHKWSIKRGRSYSQVETKELSIGDKLETFEINQIFEGVKEENAYQYGWIAGDGFIDRGQVLGLVQESEYSVLPALGGVPRKEQHPKGYSRPFTRVNLTSLVDLKSAEELRSDSIPDKIFTWDSDSISEFMGGWIDTDGCLRKNENTDHYVLHGSEGKLRSAQLLLRKIGVNHATLRLESPEGHETNYGTRNQDLWCLLIPSYECSKIKTKLKIAERIGSRYRINNAHPDSIIDSARKQKVVSIVKLNEKQDSYCFTEPLRNMGVFGNCLTYQCLVETYPANHESAEEYIDTLKYAYLYAKSVTLVNTHSPLTNSVMLRNRRIGLSQSGVQQAIKKFGTKRYFKDFCDEGYGVVKYWDKIYSRWLGIPVSIRVTSIKPSGTVSLLTGATPGVHCTHAEQYFRTVRIAANSPLVQPLVNSGYRIEVAISDLYKMFKITGKQKDNLDYDNPDEVLYKWNELEETTREKLKSAGSTLVVYFPVKETNFTKSKYDISVWEQISLVREMQSLWADNSVSVTITFQEDEIDDLITAVERNAPYLKALSFLKLSGHRYLQAPYTDCTQEEFDTYKNSLQPLDFSNVAEAKIAGSKFCDGDKCEL